MRQLPTGWTVRKTRFLWCLVDPTGKDRSFWLNRRDCSRRCGPSTRVWRGSAIRIQADRLQALTVSRNTLFSVNPLLILAQGVFFVAV